MAAPVTTYLSGQRLPCAACNGQGEACLVCRGAKLGWMIGGVFTVWSPRLTSGWLRERRYREAIRFAMRLVACALSVSGLAVLLVDTVTAFAQARPPVAFLFETSFASVVFWGSMVANVFIYSLLEREVAGIVRIPRRVYEGSPLERLHRPRQPHEPAIDMWATLTDSAARAITASASSSLAQSTPLTAAYLARHLLQHSSVRVMLSRLGIRADALRARIERADGHQDIVSTTDIAAVMAEAFAAAYQSRQLFLDVPYLFVAVATCDPLVSEILYSENVDRQKLINVLSWQQNDERLANTWRRYAARMRLRPRNRLDRAMTAIATPTLDYFSTDYTEQAQWGSFLPAVSRPDITEQVLRILDTGRSAVLVGHPGVGKMGILEDVAQRMAANDVPARLMDKRLVSVSLAKLVSGATPSEAEGRLQQLLYEASRSGNIILVFEEVQGLVGLSSGQGGSVDVAGVLATFLRRLGLRAIATTVPGAYRQSIESAALGGTFEKVDLPEPTIDQTIRIVETRLATFESRYGLFFSYQAVETLVTLTDRYIHDTHLPKKALVLLDELSMWVRQRGRSSLVTAQDVSAFLSAKLSMPLSATSDEESSLLLHFEDKIHERVVDQVEAVSAVANALRRARARVRDQSRPVANFLFLGPTGVGKTELAKAVADVYFGDTRRVVRLDMSEYQDPSSIHKLIGAAGESGILTEAVRNAPFALLLLDEIEKANPDILNIFLQVMDDARLTDGRGQTVDFRNTILIATSNAGSQFIQESLAQGVSVDDLQRELVERELKHHFQPEFLNRFDGIIVFKPLSQTDVEHIAHLLLKGLATRLEREQGILFDVTSEGVHDVAMAGFHPTLGARPLRRVIQDRIDAELARLILQKQLRRRDRVTLGASFALSVTPAREL